MDEQDKIYPPTPPPYVGRDGEVERFAADVMGEGLEGEFRWSQFWGWSNFIADNPGRFRTPEPGVNMRTCGVLANPARPGDAVPGPNGAKGPRGVRGPRATPGTPAGDYVAAAARRAREELEPAAPYSIKDHAYRLTRWWRRWFR